MANNRRPHIVDFNQSTEPYPNTKWNPRDQIVKQEDWTFERRPLTSWGLILLFWVLGACLLFGFIYTVTVYMIMPLLESF